MSEASTLWMSNIRGDETGSAWLSEWILLSPLPKVAKPKLIFKFAA
jgi:hypothetical protein